MRVEIKLSKATYAVDITDESYNAIKLGIVEDKNSKNYGNQKETSFLTKTRLFPCKNTY